MVEFFKQNYHLILNKSFEHLYLSAIALFLGIVVAVPLGIVLIKSKPLAKIVMTIASILQTVPSFALLAIMIPIFGVGKVPAVIALFIYSLLPIMRNTYLGLQSVNKNYLDAAKGMGMTRKQVLFNVRIPLAMPVIMSGIRLSAIYLLAWTTLASYIGAGGLGDFIFNGLQNAIAPMILWGTIPVSIMAIILDTILGSLEKKLSPNKVSEGK